MIGITGIFDTGAQAAPGAEASEASEAGRRGSATVQCGVIRNNCLDCLDRTTVAQFCVGMAALSLQLQRLELRAPEDGAMLSFTDEKDLALMSELAELFKLMGHSIAVQYAGSGAHMDVLRGMDDLSSEGTMQQSLFGGAAVGAAEGWGVKLLTNARRYYSNTFTDREKQDAINVFLGKFAPWRDVRLHSRGGGFVDGGAYQHVWEWDDVEMSIDGQCTDHFIHNPPHVDGADADDVEQHDVAEGHAGDDGGDARAEFARSLTEPVTLPALATTLTQFDSLFADEWRPLPDCHPIGWEVEASDSSPSKAATARREGSALSNEEMIASLQSIDSEGAVTPRETKQGDALVHTASARRWRDVRNVVAATQAFQAVTKQHEGRPDGKDRRLRHHNLLHVPAKLSAELDVLAALSRDETAAAGGGPSSKASRENEFFARYTDVVGLLAANSDASGASQKLDGAETESAAARSSYFEGHLRNDMPTPAVEGEPEDGERWRVRRPEPEPEPENVVRNDGGRSGWGVRWVEVDTPPALRGKAGRTKEATDSRRQATGSAPPEPAPTAEELAAEAQAAREWRMAMLAQQQQSLAGQSHSPQEEAQAREVVAAAAIAAIAEAAADERQASAAQELTLETEAAKEAKRSDQKQEAEDSECGPGDAEGAEARAFFSSWLRANSLE